MLLLMSRQLPASIMLLIILSVTEVFKSKPKSSSTTVCMIIHTSHHAENAILNRLSDKDDTYNYLFNLNLWPEKNRFQVNELLLSVRPECKFQHYHLRIFLSTPPPR